MLWAHHQPIGRKSLCCDPCPKCCPQSYTGTWVFWERATLLPVWLCNQRYIFLCHSLVPVSWLCCAAWENPILVPQKLCWLLRESRPEWVSYPWHTDSFPVMSLGSSLAKPGHVCLTDCPEHLPRTRICLCAFHSHLPWWRKQKILLCKALLVRGGATSMDFVLLGFLDWNFPLWGVGCEKKDIFKNMYFIHLFFGCSGSSLLHGFFSLIVASGGGWVSHCSGFSCCEARVLSVWA